MIIPRMFASEQCDCRRYASKLDRWGVAKCEANFDRIVSRLVIRSKRRAFVKYFPAVSRLVATQWLTTAIERAKQSEIPEPVSAEPMTAVWVYWAGGAVADELRYSMRSAFANLGGMRNAVICGDRPDWYRGDFIRSKRFNEQDAIAKFGSGRFCKWIDSIVKLRRIIDSPLVTDRFLWLYDDTFIMRPTTINDLAFPRAGGSLINRLPPRRRSKNTWRVVQYRTAKALESNGMPTRNFSTHFPAVFDKAKLLETIERFECDHRPRLIESLYQNHHARRIGSISNFFQYSRNPTEDWKVRESSVVINAGIFTRSLQRKIRERFPDPCPAEKVAATSEQASV